jgi:NAD-dependent DNA ligase
MPSAKLTQALRSKTTLSGDEIASLTENEGWRALYEIARSTRDQRDQICFTGFGKVECDELKKTASDTGWLKVVGSVTAKLAFLCTGDTPGPAKVAKAEKLGATSIDRDEFRDLITDGIVPRF